MTSEELNAHRAEVVAAWNLHQAGGAVPAVSDTVNGVVIPLDQRPIVLDALVRKHGAWSSEETRFLRAEALRQLGA